MKIRYKKRFRNAISNVADFIESKNTPGSGLRWTKKMIERIKRKANFTIEYPLCKSEHLAKFNYRCFHIDEWVVAYKKNRDTFTIYRFIHGSRLR